MKNNQTMTNKISHYLATESGKDEEVILFGFKLFTSFILGYLVLIVLAVKLGIFYETITAGLTVSFFRTFSGGAHASSQWRCNLIGLLILIPIGFFVKYDYLAVNPFLGYLLLLTTILGIWSTYIYAPADTPGKPVTSQVQKKYLRRISFTLLFVWSILCIFLVLYEKNLLINRLIFASCLGMVWQIFSITPIGYLFVHFLDSLLKIITERRRENEPDIC
ncbi:hypothetical protein DCMF_23525 [Candidatus Formimonas warabiya]|uniref:Accessory regulator AgrB n=2 Tax=Formimonas warabiya TaxID=1761012 RepID=A0A3G1KYN6_FORW1|nr:hypothetical protein DCMF_23525 [Candidatus Formimonas warabiya]